MDLHRLRQDTGAAAVEFALVLPLLVTLAFGTAEFGRLYNVQSSLTAAAREGVRVMALQNDPAAARTTAVAAAPTVALTTANVAVSPTCPAGGTATVSVTYTFPMVTGLFGPDLTLTGKGVMRCGG